MSNEVYKCFQDIRNMISDMPLACPDLYMEDYVELVSKRYFYLLETKGWLGWFDETPQVSEDEFWECFKCAEKNQE